MTTVDSSRATAQGVVTPPAKGICGCGADSRPSRRAVRDVAYAAVTCECTSGGQVSETINVQATSKTTFDAGVPGASLQREYERRAAARATRLRREHPVLGGLILALTEEPQSTNSFWTGASGERRAAEKVGRHSGTEVQFLFNRSLGRGRRDGDIDILAVGPAGVYVVDVKSYPRAQIEVRHSGPRRDQRQHLMIRGRDETDLLNSLDRQVVAVRAALMQHPYGAEIPVSAAFCFMDAHLPVCAASVSGVPLLGARGTAKLVSTAGVLDAAARADILAVLAAGLPAAR